MGYTATRQSTPPTLHSMGDTVLKEQTESILECFYVFLICKASDGKEGHRSKRFTPVPLTYACLLWMSTIKKRRLRLQIDLQDAYVHILIHPDMRTNLPSKGRCVSSRYSLNYWTQHSGQMFTQLGHAVAGYLHHLEISMISYLDDLLVLHQALTTLQE